MMKNDEKGFVPIGGLNAQTVAIVVLLALIGAVWLGYVDLPGPDGNTGISWRVYGPDGETLSVLGPNDSETFQYVPSLGVVKDPDTGAEIAGVEAILTVEPQGQNVQGPVSVNYTYGAVVKDLDTGETMPGGGSGDGSFAQDIALGTEASKTIWHYADVEALLIGAGFQTGHGGEITANATVTGTASSGETSSTDVSGTLEFSYEAETLTINSNVNMGELSITG